MVVQKLGAAFIGCGAVLLSGLVGTPAAQAMTTTACTLKGTSGNDTIAVTVPASTTVVVCAGAGTDTININSVNATGTLWIALGAGTKTINWNAGDLNFSGFSSNQGFVSRPATGVTVNMGGSNGAVGGAWFTCGTNAQFQAAASIYDIYNTYGKRIRWSKGSGLQNGCV